MRLGAIVAISAVLITSCGCEPRAGDDGDTTAVDAPRNIASPIVLVARLVRTKSGYPPDLEYADCGDERFAVAAEYRVESVLEGSYADPFVKVAHACPPPDALRSGLHHELTLVADVPSEWSGPVIDMLGTPEQPRFWSLSYREVPEPSSVVALRVRARLLRADEVSAHCGIFFIAAAREYEVLEVLEGEYSASRLVAVQGCPELGPVVGIGLVYELELSETLATQPSVDTMGHAGQRRYWIVSARASTGI